MIEEYAGIDCIPYSELNLPMYSSYYSMGDPFAQTLQKWMSPDPIEDREFEETEGEVYQYGIEGVSSLRTYGKAY